MSMGVDDVISSLLKQRAYGSDPDLPRAGASDFLAGKRILVTGGGGSIGSAFCQVAARLRPARLTVLDRDDSALHAVGLALGEFERGSERGPELRYLLRDICDTAELHDVFAAERPDVVVHAAALKHVPVLEEHPGEAFRVNVLGTRSTLAAAAASGAGVFVNVSTDKASNPASVLGLTKRLGERMTAFCDLKHGGRYVSVRFGNVIGSRGSFLPTFVDRIERDLPLLVAHEDATRFLMDIDKAIELVLSAAERGEGGDTLIADMGKPIRILDLARSLLATYGKSKPIRIGSLRAGDKLHEDWCDDSETPTTDSLPDGLIRVRVSPVDPDSLTLEEFLGSLARRRAARSGALAVL
jgi:FlaA1/EpsC-like NDP-sugar epimerase